MSLSTETNIQNHVKGNIKPISTTSKQTTNVTFSSTEERSKDQISSENKLLLTLGGLALAGIGLCFAFKKGKTNTVTRTASNTSNMGSLGTKGADTAKKPAKSITTTGLKDTNSVAQEAEKITSDVSNPHISSMEENVSPNHIETPKTIISSKNSITADEIKSTLKAQSNFWEVSSEAIDEETAEILSRHLPQNIKYQNADIFAKSLIEEANNVESIAEKTKLLKKAIELLPAGSYNKHQYTDALRKEILEEIIEITKDPKSKEAQQIIKSLGISLKKDDSIFERLLNQAPNELDFYSYSKIQEHVGEDALSELMYKPESAFLPFIRDKLFEIAKQSKSPKEKAYIMEKALNLFETNRYLLFQDNWIKMYYAAERVPELSQRVHGQISKDLRTFLPELDTSKISLDTQKNIFAQIFGFKQGACSLQKAEEYMPYDKINDILTVIKKAKLSNGQNISEEEISILKDTAQKIAKNGGLRYEEALSTYFETGRFNIFTKKGDKTLCLEELRGNKFFTNEEEKIAYEYIECGDGNIGAFQINDLLRTTSEEQKQTILGNRPDIAKIIKGLDKLTTETEHAITGECVVFRAIGSGKHVNEFKKVGNIVTDKGFVSTTPNMGTYTNMFGGRPGESYIMRIKLPKGTTGCNMKRCKGQYWGGNEEFLLPRNSQFRVLEVDEKAKIIEVEYILPQ